MLDRFLSFLNDEYAIGNPAESSQPKLLLTVSGGIDSVVLTDLCYRATLPFSIAHVNFGLRAEESDGDEAFVRNLAQAYMVPVHCIRFETAKAATDAGESIQMAARRLRYAWFEQLVHEFGYTYIATAHHQNDVLETVLLNLARGTGIAGLRGIPTRQDKIIRPLWFATRAEIEAYVAEQGLQWREDSSNSSDKYLRNQVRHHIIPHLEALNANFWGTFQRTMGRIRAAENLLENELIRAWASVTEQAPDGRILIDKEKVRSLTEMDFRLTEWLRPYGFTHDQVGQIIASMNREPGQVFMSATHHLWNEATRLVLIPANEKQLSAIHWEYLPLEEVNIAGWGQLRFTTFDKPIDFRPPTDQSMASLDADAVPLPLELRPWQLGDRFQPLGMRGQKLISDFLNEQKVPRPDRANVQVLVAGGRIVWVVGYRIAQQAKITDKTTRIVQISLSV